MILIIGSNSRILKNFLLSRKRSSFLGIDLNKGDNTNIQLKSKNFNHKNIIEFLKIRKIKVSSIIFAARNKYVENAKELIDENEICMLTKFYWNLIYSLYKYKLVENALKILFLNSTNGRLISQQCFSYHANCALLDIFAKFLYNKISEEFNLNCAVINFQIGLVKLPEGNLNEVSKAFEKVYGQGNVINTEILKNILEVNLNDISFLKGYREVRIGTDPAFDTFFSTKLLLS